MEYVHLVIGLLFLALVNWTPLVKTVDGVEGVCLGKKSCHPKSRCILSPEELSSFECDLPPTGKGSCCEDVVERTSGVLLSNRQDRNSPAKKTLVRPKDATEGDIEVALRNTIVPRETSQNRNGGHGLFTKPRDEDQDIRDAAYKLAFLKIPRGSVLFSNRDDDSVGLNSDNSNEIRDNCLWKTSRKPNCNLVLRLESGNREFRTIDGSCNNVEEPLYGMSGTPMQRIVPSTYRPFVHLPRKSLVGEDLPSARLVSNTVFKEGTQRTNSDFTHHLMQFGQFLDHDITHGPTFSEDSNGRPCCNLNAGGKKWDFPGVIADPIKCFPIEVPDNDPLWGQQGSRRQRRTCMEFGRTTFSLPLDCRAGTREQMNDITHWIDLSNIYGSTPKEFEELRDPVERHRLLVTTGSSLLPRCFTRSAQEQRLRDNSERAAVSVCQECSKLERTQRNKCFFSGDLRINEQPGLATMHTLFVREHNRVADELLLLSSSPSKEDIFEEARRIVIAEWQHIVYQEWLPNVLGKNYMETFEMLPLSFGYSSKYNPSIDPRINNEFATAAFRFGHSLVYSALPQRDAAGRKLQEVDLKSVFDDPSDLDQPNFIENTLRGMSGDAVPAFDSDFAEDILHNLFEDDLDLPALNIQRGRDHGIPGYNRYRRKCQSRSSRFRAVNSIDELSNDGRISRDAVNKLKQVYDDIDDVDLFVGGILEFAGPHDDSLLGPTFKCIIGDQFRRLKEGDRFWYENGDNPTTRFTLQQLDEIRNKVSMARIFCDNSDIGSTQPLVFRLEGLGNSRVQCSDAITIPRIDLTSFIEDL